MQVGDLDFNLAWRAGTTRPVLTISGYRIPIALTTEVNRGAVLSLAKWLETVATGGLRSDYTNELQPIPEAQEAPK